MSQILVGDAIEVESDSGTVTNAPWRNKVIAIDGNTFTFDEGGAKVDYTLDEANLVRTHDIKGEDGPFTLFVFAK